MIDVAVAVVLNDGERVLLAQRLKNQFKGGYWEFPGGKVEEDEAVLDALGRELLEEVNLTPESSQFLGCFEHHYDEMSVRLHFYLVRQWLGELRPCLGQKLIWAQLDELDNYRLPEANHAFVAKIKQAIAVVS